MTSDPGKTVLYFDCISGISGDMTLAAMIDVGVPLEAIQDGIDSLGLPSCKLVATEVKRKGFRATHVQVQYEPEHAHRHLHHITDMIDSSRLTAPQQELAKAIFTRLGEAEAKVHGTTLQKVHFHEVGAVDSIADIVGTAIGLDFLGAQSIYCSPVPTGTGEVVIAHGRVSVPAPATAELLKGCPLAACDIEAELTTPTGAAIVKTVVDHFGPLPAMEIQQIGYGAGTRELEQQGNVLRLFVGSTVAGATRDTVTVLETNVDDLSGEVVGHCFELLYAAGALDVYATAIQMKKNRPAIKLTVLCDPSDQEPLEAILFRETTTLGIRRWSAARSKLPREPHTVGTPWGSVDGKLATLPDGTARFSPEFEACRRLATEHDVPLSTVFEAARLAYRAASPE